MIYVPVILFWKKVTVVDKSYLIDFVLISYHVISYAIYRTPNILIERMIFKNHLKCFFLSDTNIDITYPGKKHSNKHQVAVESPFAPNITEIVGTCFKVLNVILFCTVEFGKTMTD